MRVIGTEFETVVRFLFADGSVVYFGGYGVVVLRTDGCDYRGDARCEQAWLSLWEVYEALGEPEPDEPDPGADPPSPAEARWAETFIVGPSSRHEPDDGDRTIVVTDAFVDAVHDRNGLVIVHRRSHEQALRKFWAVAECRSRVQRIAE